MQSAKSRNGGSSTRRCDEVARTAHVGKGTVYLYFSSKEDLVVALFDRFADRLLWILDRVLAEGNSFREAVYDLVSKEITDGEDSGRVFRLMSQQPFLSDLSLQQEKETFVRRVIERVASGIRAAIDRGLIRPCDPRLCACLLLSLPGAVSLYESAFASGPRTESLPRAGVELADLLWNGMMKEGAS